MTHDAQRLARHCTCGGSLTGRAAPSSAAQGVVAAFDEIHHGEGHAPTTANRAAAARRKDRT